MRTDDLDFELPAELIAQTPTPTRGRSRLLHYQRGAGTIAHRTFADFPTLLRQGDLLVFNDAKVIPARFVLRKPTGGRIEGLFLYQIAPGRWRVALKGAQHPGPPMIFEDAPSITAQTTAAWPQGEYDLSVSSDEDAISLLDRIGKMPLPPYIKRAKTADPNEATDRQRYQTIYAKAPGAVAAPTAGLHFTEADFDAISAARVETTFLTLHVGAGTFRPVTVENLSDHPMHAERFEISIDAAEKLNRARQDRRRIVAVGTTSARVLESWHSDKAWTAAQGETSIFIQPGYAWKHVGALLTNFHMPRSTLIALVASFVGLEEQRRIYGQAIAKKYRFFSYGDAMFAE